MIHHAERLVPVTTFKKFNRFVRDDIRSISFFYYVFSIFPEVRSIVVTLFMLTAQDTPMVKSLRFADEMPFTNHCSLVAGLLKQFRECLLIAIECACIIGKTIFVTEFTGEDTSA